MPKASFALPDGTMVTIDGTAEEVQRLLSVYATGKGNASSHPTAQPRRTPTTSRAAGSAGTGTEERPDLSAIINLVKTCPEADAIERTILDKNSLVDRTLLPLYVAHEYLEDAVPLTSGQISNVTKDLGIPVRPSHASTTLSTTAARYVVGDKVRKPGVAVHYKLSRRGVQYMKAVVTGDRSAREE